MLNDKDIEIRDKAIKMIEKVRHSDFSFDEIDRT